jgi:hypothetical protein
MARFSLHLAVLGLALLALVGGAMLPTRVVDSADAKDGVVDAGQIGALASTPCCSPHPSSPSPFPVLLTSLPSYPPYPTLPYPTLPYPTLPREPTFGASCPDPDVVTSPLSSSLAATKQD